MLPATRYEISEVCPGCSDAFIDSQIARQATVIEAGKAYARSLQAQITASKDQQQAAERESRRHSPSMGQRLGVRPITGSYRGRDDSTSADLHPFEQAVNDLMERGMSRADAVKQVAHNDPELRRSYVVAINARAGRSVDPRSI